ncbi:MAG: signal peptidase I [Actinomycetota bacterium]|nr:signal peptidase I [Actinomycetota bacterium]
MKPSEGVAAGVSSVTAVAPATVVTAMAAWTWLTVRLVARLSLSFVVALTVFSLLPLVFGMTGSAVFGGSMRPHLRAGDVVLSFPLPQDVTTPMGRVVTFRGSASGKSTTLIIHRIVGTNPDGTLITSGDANIQVDSTPLPRSRIIGQAYVLIPWVGLPLLWIVSGAWAPLSIWVVVSLLALAIEALGGSEPRSRSARAPPRFRRPVLVRQLSRLAMSAALVTAVMVVIAVLGPANAVFTARTSSLGNNWAYPAATPATKLAFVTNPSNGTGGVVLAIQPSVRLLDAAGKATTGTAVAITLSLTTPAGATLSCSANPVTTASGVSTFGGCAVDKVGTYTLTATSPSLTAAVSTSFAIAVGPATKLVFSASPSTTPINSAFATQPVVTVVDAGGNRVTSTIAVTLTLTTAAGATLSCTTNPRTAVAGTATFAGCRINRAGTYTLTAAAPGVASTVSPAFVIGQYTSCANAASADQGNAYFQYHLDEDSNSSSAGNSVAPLGFLTPGTYRGSMTSSAATPLACPRDTGGAYVLNGSTSYVSTPQQYTNPTTFSEELWFKTTVAGGRLMGFGDAQTGLSTHYDRQLYIGTTGTLNFGTYNGVSLQVLTTPTVVTDGLWHHVAATMSAATGMKLYLDGTLVSANPAWVTPENYNGWWRLGYDNLNAWPSQGAVYFSGQMRFAAAYAVVLSATQVQNHWAAGQ